MKDPTLQTTCFLWVLEQEDTLHNHENRAAELERALQPIAGVESIRTTITKERITLQLIFDPATDEWTAKSELLKQGLRFREASRPLIQKCS